MLSGRFVGHQPDALRLHAKRCMCLAPPCSIFAPDRRVSWLFRRLLFPAPLLPRQTATLKHVHDGEYSGQALIVTLQESRRRMEELDDPVDLCWHVS
jgi:hypothetical protein